MVGANRRRRAPARTTRSSEDTGSRLRLWDRACATPSAVCIVRSVLAGESRGRRGFYSSPCQQPLKSSWLLESFNWPWPWRWLLCIACKWTVSHPRLPLLERTGEEGQRGDLWANRPAAWLPPPSRLAKTDRKHTYWNFSRASRKTSRRPGI